MNEKVSSRVEEYISSCKTAGSITYPREMKGYWKVTGGLRNAEIESGDVTGGSRSDMGIIVGKYENAVAWALGKKEFYKDPALHHEIYDGTIEQVVPKKVGNNGILKK